MDSTETIVTVATWGYQPSGAAHIFDLALGETLPDGWDASPSVITDPMLASAEALSAAVQGRVYVPAIAAEVRVDVPAVDTEMLGNALAEIERLQGVIASGMEENAGLVADIEAAEKALDEASTAMRDLRDSLAKAHEDGRVNAAERDAAKTAVEALTADLAKAHADLAEATKPKPAVTTPAKGR
jgi:hypothetical protein